MFSHHSFDVLNFILKFREMFEKKITVHDDHENPAVNAIILLFGVPNKRGIYLSLNRLSPLISFIIRPALLE